MEMNAISIKRSRRTGSFAAGLVWSLMMIIHLPGFSQGKTQKPKEDVLFAFDDYSIPFKHNLKLTLVQAEKYAGNPVLRRGPEGAPDHGHAVLYGTVIKTGNKFRMWYLGMIESNNDKVYKPGWYRPMCYAESTDGINWVKPELVAGIKFSEWTHLTNEGGAKLRAPVFMGLRNDKNPEECVL